MAVDASPDAQERRLFSRLQPRSLHQRLVLFVLLPVALLLFLMGMIGFVFARNSLLTQWQEAAVLKLQRAAHHADMRLIEPKEWLELFSGTIGRPGASAAQQVIIERLQAMEGVAYVNLTWDDAAAAGIQTGRGGGQMQGQMGGGQPMGMRSTRMARARQAEIMPPRYDELVADDIVVLVSTLNGPDGKCIGRLKVAVRFDYIIQDVVASEWWQNLKAFLVDDAGRVLTCTVPGGSPELCFSPMMS